MYNLYLKFNAIIQTISSYDFFCDCNKLVLIICHYIRLGKKLLPITKNYNPIKNYFSKRNDGKFFKTASYGLLYKRKKQQINDGLYGCQNCATNLISNSRNPRLRLIPEKSNESRTSLQTNSKLILLLSK